MFPVLINATREIRKNLEIREILQPLITALSAQMILTAPSSVALSELHMYCKCNMSTTFVQLSSGFKRFQVVKQYFEQNESLIKIQLKPKKSK